MSAAFKPVRHRYDDALSRLSWRELQQRIAAHFEALGYAVDCAQGGDVAGHDADLVLRRGDETIIVSFRHWTAFQVPHTDVHRLLGLIPVTHATGAMLVTSGEFTRQAVDAAARFRHVRLVDGRALRAMLGPIEDLPGYREASPRLPEWAPLGPAATATTHGATEPHQTGRVATIAAVAAMLVMAVAMLTLYTWYIRDSHETRPGTMANVDPAYRHDGAAPAPPPFAQPEARPPEDTGGGH